MNFPRPMAVELLPHDPRWAAMVEQAGAAFSSALAPVVVTVHHVGSTAIPSMSAKPILDSCLFPRLQRQQVGVD